MNGEIVLDLGDTEDKEGEADVPLAYMPKLDQVTLLQMDGILTAEETIKAVEMAIEGSKQIYEIQREALKKKYGMTEEESEEKIEEAKDKAPEKTPEDAPEEEEEEK
jgi:exosome complex component RRP41